MAAQHEARDGVYLEDLRPAGAGSHAFHEALLVHGRLAVDEAEGHELGDAAGPALDVAQQRQVARLVLRRLHMAVHDGGGGGDAQLMGRCDDLHPLRPAQLLARPDGGVEVG